MGSEMCIRDRKPASHLLHPVTENQPIACPIQAVRMARQARIGQRRPDFEPRKMINVMWAIRLSGFATRMTRNGSIESRRGGESNSIRSFEAGGRPCKSCAPFRRSPSLHSSLVS